MDCYLNESSTKLTKVLMQVCQLIMKRLKKVRCPVILRTYCFPGQHNVQVGKRVYRYIEHTLSQNSVTDVCQSLSIVMIYQPIRLTSPCIQAIGPERTHLSPNRQIREQAINHIFIHFIQYLKCATCCSLFHEAIMKVQYQKYKRGKLLLYINITILKVLNSKCYSFHVQKLKCSEIL